MYFTIFQDKLCRWYKILTKIYIVLFVFSLLHRRKNVCTVSKVMFAWNIGCRGISGWRLWAARDQLALLLLFLLKRQDMRGGPLAPLQISPPCCLRRWLSLG